MAVKVIDTNGIERILPEISDVGKQLNDLYSNIPISTVLNGIYFWVDDEGKPHYQVSNELDAVQELENQLLTGELIVANAADSERLGGINAEEYASVDAVQELENQLLTGELIVANADNADGANNANNAASLGNIAASEYYSTQNKPTPADVGLGKTLTVEIAGTTAEFDGSKDVTIDVSQKYFHAIMYRWYATDGDAFQAKVNIYIFLDKKDKQTNPMSFKDKLSDLGYTSASNYYSADGYVFDTAGQRQEVYGVFADNNGISVVYEGNLTHTMAYHKITYSNDAVTPLITVNT